MPDLPIYVYVLPPIVIAMLIASVVMRRRGIAGTQHATVGALAQRLGLSILEGDPSTNLYYLTQPGRNETHSIRLAGQPYGRRVEFDFTNGKRTQDYLVLVSTTYTWGCYLAVHLNAPVPDFEVTARQPTQYLEPEVMLSSLPEVRTGDPELDSNYRIVSADPRIAPALAPALRQLSGMLYVHLVAQKGVVMMPITRTGLNYVVHDAERVLQALVTAAGALDGQPAPQQVYPAHSL
jgi:hypothetical protein